MSAAGDPRTDRTPGIAIAALLLALLSPTLFPQAAPVYVTCSFQDKNGLFLENLTPADIQVFEDGRPASIEFLAMDQMQVVYGLIFEKGLITDSQWQDRRTELHATPGIKSAQDMAYELIDKRLGQQAVWVAAYDRELEVVLEPTTDGFQAKDAIHVIRGVRHPNSSLYSALFSGIQKMAERSEKRRILLVFLDQVDADTVGKMRPLKNLISGSNVEVFTISFGSRTGAGRDGLSAVASQGALRDLAKVSCGEAFFAAEYREHLDDISRRLLQQIRTLHTIGFHSSSASQNGGKLLIRCSAPGSRVKHHPTIPILH
jgi:hypothetical protein